MDKDSMMIKTPDWIKESVIYQIFPDRFCRSMSLQVDGLFEPWETKDSPHGFKAGNLKGVIEKIDYLKELGVNTIYFNPIFKSSANHRYHTYDYYNVDPILGGNDAFKELLNAAHAANIKIIIDGVFNHCGRGFFQFNHILENGKDSPYRDWFTIHHYPVKAYNLAHNEKPNYACWWNLPALPKFNIKNTEVRQFLLDVVKYWTTMGVDGWRLDVPNEIKDDSFWQEFRKTCKEINPDCYIAGEIWGDAEKWLQGNMFDAVMNYRLAYECICYFAGEKISVTHTYDGKRPHHIDHTTFKNNIEQLMGAHDWEITKSQMNIFTSHDTDRMLNIYSYDRKRMILAVVFAFFLPGVPCIYYGEEMGLTGILHDGTRQTVNWDRNNWDNQILQLYKDCISIRRATRAFSHGAFEFIQQPQDAGEDQLIIYKRSLDNVTCIIIVNNNNRTISINTAFNNFKESTYKIVLSSKNDAVNTLIKGNSEMIIEPYGYSVLLDVI